MNRREFLKTLPLAYADAHQAPAIAADNASLPDTAHQIQAASLIRYTLSLPISVAVIGVASIAQLQENVRIVREAAPMSAIER